MPSLPEITSQTLRHPDCCLSLSRGILGSIIEGLPEESLILSIGSGTGLLETLLMQKDDKVIIQGVEVNSTVNKWLSSDQLHVVKGTWELCQEAQDAETWLFVYPRNPTLVTKYITEYGSSRNLKCIIWIGPTLDWNDFGPCFEPAPWKIGDSNLLTPFETLVKVSKGSC